MGATKRSKSCSCVFFCSCKSKGRGTERYGMDIPLLGDSFTPGDIFQQIFFTELQKEVLLCCYFFFSHGLKTAKSCCWFQCSIVFLWGEYIRNLDSRSSPSNFCPLVRTSSSKRCWSWCDLGMYRDWTPSATKWCCLLAKYIEQRNTNPFEDRFRIDYEMFSIVFLVVLPEEKPSTSLRNNNITFRMFSVSWDWENQIGVGKINCMIGWIDVWCMISTYTQLVINFQVSTKKGQDKPTHRSLSAELQGSRRSSPSISRASHGGALMQLTKGDADDSRVHRFI